MINDIEWLNKFQTALFGSLFGVSLLALLVKQDVRWLLSIVAGGGFIILNYFILKKIVGFFLNGRTFSKVHLVGFILVKLISFLAMLGCGVYFFPDQILGFVMGISIIFVAAFVVVLRGFRVHAS